MIFARRSIQRFIDQISQTLPQVSISKLVQKLNRNDRASLDFEWEAAVLFALHQVGKIAYETNHGGKGFPDVTFRLPDKKGIGFVADITAVSDSGLEDENPTRMLSEFLMCSETTAIRSPQKWPRWPRPSMGISSSKARR